MLKINRIKVVIDTDDGKYGIDETFYSGLNFIASDDNTSGKSALLACIYYALGFEQILNGSGVGAKTLPYVLKSQIKNDNNTTATVLESVIILEISNGESEVTLIRNVKKQGYDDRLISVCECGIKDYESEKKPIVDYYVNTKNSATYPKGFHNYLEVFLGLKLPLVPTNDSKERKLYLQALFSALMIEQKVGWSSIMSGMPLLGLSDVKTRVVEFLLALETLENERKRKEASIKKRNIQERWNVVCKNIERYCEMHAIVLKGLNREPHYFKESDKDQIIISKNGVEISEYIVSLQCEIDLIKPTTIKVDDKSRIELTAKLEEVGNIIVSKEKELSLSRTELTKLLVEKEANNRDLNLIETDLENNLEAIKLKKLGSENNIKSFDNICPTCGQSVQDNLIESELFMTIEQNIMHLKEQKILLDYILVSCQNRIEALKLTKSFIEEQLNNLRSYFRTISEDLLKINDEVSESQITERVEKRMELFNIKQIRLVIGELISELAKIGTEWENHQNISKQIPNERINLDDRKKINRFQEDFKNFLRDFRFRSTEINDINISEQTFLPSSAGFDLRFDSSASDEIRVVWAFTLAILKSKSKNCPQIVIYDEPKQHNVVDDDVKTLFDRIIEQGSEIQAIVGITSKEENTRNMIRKLGENNCHIINLGKLAFKKFDH